MEPGLPSLWNCKWDEAKSRRNVVARRLSFEQAIEVFDRPRVTRSDNRRDHGETRLVATGIAGGDVLTCVCTERPAVRRIISVRSANRRERNGYRATYSS